MEITFEALIKELKIKSLVSLDKVARLTIDFSAENDEVVNQVNKAMRADEMVKITIARQG